MLWPAERSLDLPSTADFNDIPARVIYVIIGEAIPGPGSEGLSYLQVACGCAIIMHTGKENMNISTRSVGEIVAIDIEGKLDTQTSTPALEELLQLLESSPGKVLISLTPLEFISSAGLRVILRVAKHVRRRVVRASNEPGTV